MNSKIILAVLHFCRIIWYKFMGGIQIPKELKDREFEILVHISDTPNVIYGDLKYLLSEIKPEYIVHTGDLVDNIKLELYPQKIDLYKKFVKVIVKIIDDNVVNQAWLVMGNHDDSTKIKNLPNVQIIEDLEEIEIDKRKFCISHYGLKTRQKKSDYHLFGHDLMLETQSYHNEQYLNGLEHIHIINLTTGEILFLKYPRGTNDYRLNKYKLGI